MASNEDYCTTDYDVAEYYCDVNGQYEVMYVDYSFCPNGCENGKCKEPKVQNQFVILRDSLVSKQLAIVFESTDPLFYSGAQAPIIKVLNEGIGQVKDFIKGRGIGTVIVYDDEQYAYKLRESTGIEVVVKKTSNPSEPSNPSVPSEDASDDDDDPSLGNKNAPVTIVEFADFECPYCKRFHEDTFPHIKDYIDSGQVYFVYRDFPLSQIHPNSHMASKAANCAYEQGNFWDMHNMLFENGVKNGVEDFKQYARNIGLNMDKFNSCLDSSANDVEIWNDIADGTFLGVTGTPAFFVNGEIIRGAQPFSVFKEAIERALGSDNGESGMKSLPSRAAQEAQKISKTPGLIYDPYEEDTPAPTCYDGVKNDGESGIDCGGPCKPCMQEVTCSNGCLLNGKCLDFGTRIVDENTAMYCNFDGKFAKQKNEAESCQNDYECGTNSCSSGKCIDLSERLEKQQGMLERILSWLGRIFGGDGK